MMKLLLIALVLLSTSSYALEPGELPGPTSSDGGGAGDKTPLPPTSSDGGWAG